MGLPFDSLKARRDAGVGTAYETIGQLRNSAYGGVVTRMSPDDRREAIIAATRTVMMRQGIASTTVRDIAAELGTSSGLIHHYVDSMDVLLAEAFERAADEDLQATEEAVARAPDPLARLAAFIDSYARGNGDSGMQLWLDAWAEAARRPDIRRTSQRLNVRWQELLRMLIAQGCDAGVMTADDPDGAAWRLLSLLDGLALQAVAHPDAVTADQSQRWSRRAAERELGLPTGNLG